MFHTRALTIQSISLARMVTPSLICVSARPRSLFPSFEAHVQYLAESQILRVNKCRGCLMSTNSNVPDHFFAACNVQINVFCYSKRIALAPFPALLITLVSMMKGKICRKYDIAMVSTRLHYRHL